MENKDSLIKDKGFSKENLKRILKEKNISQKVFYEQLKEKGFPYTFDAFKSYTSKSNVPSSAVIQLMAEILDVDISNLFKIEMNKQYKINSEIKYSILVNRELAKVLNTKCNKLSITPEEYIKSLLITNL